VSSRATDLVIELVGFSASLWIMVDSWAAE
jgi:hypothetical protein